MKTIKQECQEDDKEMITKFSGVKEEYKSGASRDNSKGKGRFDLISPIALKRLAQVYERGAINHGDRNWEKGLPLSRCMSSTLRHLNQYLNGERDEDHLAQAAWNIFAAMHIEQKIEDNKLPKELNDI